MSNFSFYHSVFKKLVLQRRKNQGLFGKELNPLLLERRLYLIQRDRRYPSLPNTTGHDNNYVVTHELESENAFPCIYDAFFIQRYLTHSQTENCRLI